MKEITFNESHDANVGDVIRDGDGKMVLVGSINTLGGTCDCCSGISWRETVEYCGNIIENPELVKYFQ